MTKSSTAAVNSELISEFNGELTHPTQKDDTGVIQDPSYFSELDFTTFQSWIFEKDLVKTLFRNNLHTSAYIDRLERILRLFVLTGSFRHEDFVTMWAFDVNSHDVIQRNVYGLLSRLAPILGKEIVEEIPQRITGRWSQLESYRDRKNLFDLMYKICSDQLTSVRYNCPTLPPSIGCVVDAIWMLMETDVAWAPKLVRLHVELLERMCDVFRNADECKMCLATYMEADLRILTGVFDPPMTLHRRFTAFTHLCFLMAQRTTGGYMFASWKQTHEAEEMVARLFGIGNEIGREPLESPSDYLGAIYSIIEFCDRNGLPLDAYPTDVENVVVNSVNMIRVSVCDVNEAAMRKEPPNENVIRMNLDLIKRLFQLLTADKMVEVSLGADGLVDILLHKFLFPVSKAFYEGKKSLSAMKNNPTLPNVLPRSSTMAERIGPPPEDALKVPSIPKSATMSDLPTRQRDMTFNNDLLCLACQVLVDISCHNVDVLRCISTGVQNMFSYGGVLPSDVIWDFEPQHFIRRTTSFVGLKNGGATCYMNAIFQQMFWSLPVRREILSLDVLASWKKQKEMEREANGFQEPKEDERMQEDETSVMEIVEDRQEVENGSLNDSVEMMKEETEMIELNPSDEVIDLAADEYPSDLPYQCQVLAALQFVFQQLENKELSYCHPKKFWEVFKSTAGYVISTRVQEDANEFWVRLAETVDDAMKLCGAPKIFEEVFGGKVVHQKVGIDGCPHRFEREEAFMQFGIDVVSHQQLTDSLQQHVNGERMDSDNAAYCDLCDQNMPCIRREAFRELPSILSFQLKRFDFEWERNAAVKFNDYFEFPMELDMYPYTYEGIEEKEKQGRGMHDKKEKQKGEGMNDSSSSASTIYSKSCMYRLKGVVVHAGEADGGHYYSFVRLKDEDKEGPERWYKFDDIDINESAVGAEQWFGGEQSSSYEMFLPENKKQKKRYNAYIILYERVNEDSSESLENGIVAAESQNGLSPAENHEKFAREVAELQNLHLQEKYSELYFHFMTTWAEKIADRIQMLIKHGTHNAKIFGNVHEGARREAITKLCLNPFHSNLATAAIEIFSLFMFNNGLHSRRALLKDFPINDLCLALRWKRAMIIMLELPPCREWFCSNVMLQKKVIQLYLLDAPAQEVRNFFAHIIITILNGMEAVPLEEVLTKVTHRSEFVNLSFAQPDDTIADIIIRLLMIIPNNSPKSLLKHPAGFFEILWHLSRSPYRREKLHKHDVLFRLLQMCLDDNHIRYLLQDRNILVVVAQLMRSLALFKGLSNRSVSEESLECDRIDDFKYAENPFGHRDQPEGFQISKTVAGVMVQMDNVKKVVQLMLDEFSAHEDEIETAYKIMGFLSYENMLIGKRLLHCFEFENPKTREHLENYLNCFFSFLVIDDSCMDERIFLGLFGEPQGFRGYINILYDLVDRHYGRTYVMYKKLVRFLQEKPDILEKLQEQAVIYDLFQECTIWFDTQMQENRRHRSNDWNYDLLQNDLGSQCRTKLGRTHSANQILESEIVKSVLQDVDDTADVTDPNHILEMATEQHGLPGRSVDNGLARSRSGSPDDFESVVSQSDWDGRDDWEVKKQHLQATLQSQLSTAIANRGQHMTSPEPATQWPDDFPGPKPGPISPCPPLRRMNARENMNFSPRNGMEMNPEVEYALEDFGVHCQSDDDESVEAIPEHLNNAQPISDDDDDDDDSLEAPEPDADCMNDASDDERPRRTDFNGLCRSSY
ncbi:hypothetical protein L596_029998 [Steinernema carpocapsae]|uniref:USP domain-containing protein n=1 Tax=Steinernema carpocapsae TaxID=34508 RepID=A0A4U5LRF6_STECR|nr:hypothetical protein L596_029998 [Steinernema carpocapsae]